MTELVEQWRPIEGYEGLYQVSNLGRVRSLDRIDCAGRRLKGKILSPEVARGYVQVQLWKEGKLKWFKVHRLVAQTFIHNPEGLPQINHKDEDKTNNIVDNLEYCDGKYNMNYGTRIERAVQTRISNGNADPELCGIGDEKEYKRLYYQKNKDRLRERHTEYMREYRRRKEKTKQTT